MLPMVALALQRSSLLALLALWGFKVALARAVGFMALGKLVAR
jgi:hypothetical protein